MSRRRDPDVSPAGQPYPVPRELETGHELCRVCFEPVREHWRGRACTPPPLTHVCFRCGTDSLVEFGSGYGCLMCLMIGLREPEREPTPP